jgi:hypothetical protein
MGGPGSRAKENPYAELGIRDLMPCSGLCRVVLDDFSKSGAITGFSAFATRHNQGVIPSDLNNQMKGKDTYARAVYSATH